MSLPKGYKLLFFFSSFLLLLPSLIHFSSFFSNKYLFYTDYFFGDSPFLVSHRFFNFSYLFFVFLLIFLGYLKLLKLDLKFSPAEISLILLIYFFIFPLGTSDWILYFDVGRRVYEGVNPYLTGVNFLNPFSFYFKSGEVKNFLPITPLFSYILSIFYFLSHKNLHIFLYIIKFFSLLLFLMSFFIFCKIFPDRREKLKLLFLLNPFLLFEFISNAHYDMYWILPGLLFIYLLMKGKTSGSILSFLVSSLMKYTGTLFGILFLRRKRHIFKVIFLYLVLFFLLSFRFNFDVFKIFNGFLIQVNWVKNSPLYLFSLFLKKDVAKIILEIIGLSLLLLFFYRHRKTFYGDSVLMDFYTVSFFLILSVIFFSSSFFPWFLEWAYIFSIPMSLLSDEFLKDMVFLVFLSQLIYPLEYYYLRFSTPEAIRVIYIFFLFSGLTLFLFRNFFQKKILLKIT